MVCRFSRLYKCKFQNQDSYIGVVYVMINCHDIDNISPRNRVFFDDDHEMTIFIQKEYACNLEYYNQMKYDDHNVNYDEILYTLLEEQGCSANVVASCYFRICTFIMFVKSLGLYLVTSNNDIGFILEYLFYL